MAEVDAAHGHRGGDRRQWKQLQSNVGNCRARRNWQNVQFNPSAGHSARKHIEVRPWKQRCVVKGLRTGSLPLCRTLHVYGLIRARGAEDWAPLPLLYKVEPMGEVTYLWMEYLGDDVAKTRIAASVFLPLKVAAMRALTDAGVRPETVTQHRKNWVVAPCRGGGDIRPS